MALHFLAVPNPFLPTQHPSDTLHSVLKSTIGNDGGEVYPGVGSAETRKGDRQERRTKADNKLCG